MINKIIKKLVFLYVYITKRNIYILNENSKEIHHLNNVHNNCKINLMTNIKYTNKKNLNSYLASEYNGCRWCFKKEDKG